MRKQDKITLWPPYFDSNKTRKEGRRVSKETAVPTPKLEEIHEAAKSLNLACEMIQNASHPKNSRQRIGLVRVSKKETKTKIIRKIAKGIRETRNM
jgi:signal recognition particle subunit SRP19